MVIDAELTQKVGKTACLLYAAVWVVAWFDPPHELTALFEGYMELRHGKYLPPVCLALLFGAAPFLRDDTRLAKIMVSLGIVLGMSNAAWVALQGNIPIGHVLYWVVVPFGIAIWVFFGPRNPEAEEREVLEQERRRPSPFAGLLFLAVLSLFLFLLAVVVLFRLPFP